MRLWLCVLVACGSSTASAPVKLPLANGAHRIAVDGVDVAFQIHGAGPVCIAHPGGPGASGEYLRMPAFEKRFTMVYIDPLGTGASGKLPATERYSIERDAKVVDAVRAKLELERVCLVGHSYGGFVALTYAIANRARGSSLFLYSTSPTTEPEFHEQVMAGTKQFEGQPWFADAMHALGTEDSAIRDEAHLNEVFQQLFPMYLADYSGRKSELDPLRRVFKLSLDPYSRREQGKQARYDVRRQLGRLGTTPTVILTGEQDFICGPVTAQWLASGIAGSKLIVLPRTGHMAHVESPAAFEDAVATFAAMQR